MEVNNTLYKNQGIHVISTIFTVEKGITKVLLIKRKNEPFNNMWALVGGALYNNEVIEDGAKREIKEKTGIENIELSLCNIFSELDRSPLMRMVAISYLGVLDNTKVKILNKTLKTSDSDWVDVSRIPKLAYDHNKILEDALEKFKVLIVNSDILKSLFPNGFTIPEINKTYESILGYTLDRRNFRRKLLSLNLIVDTNKTVKFEGNKPAKLYKFKNLKKEYKNVF